MVYTLDFLFSVKRDPQNQEVVHYDPEKLARKTVKISVPDVVNIFEPFIESLEEVGLVEKTSPKSDSSPKKKGSDRPDDEEQSEKKAIATSSPLKLVSDTAYICQSKELDEVALNQLCAGLVQYLQECCSNFSQDTFLSQETGVCVSGIQQVLELRNYLTTFTNSKKKMYKEGYLYVINA